MNCTLEQLVPKERLGVKKGGMQAGLQAGCRRGIRQTSSTKQQRAQTQNSDVCVGALCQNILFYTKKHVLARQHYTEYNYMYFL